MLNCYHLGAILLLFTQNWTRPFDSPEKKAMTEKECEHRDGQLITITSRFHCCTLYINDLPK